MNIFLNGQQQQAQTTTLAELIASLSLPAAGVAAAVEGKLVKRTEWETFPLAEGMHVTVVRAVCGG